MTLADDIYGLLLVGGKSSRMQKDKAYLNYFGLPQLEYMYNLLNNVLEKTFVSVRKDQKIAQAYPVIEDQYELGGPINGILSALDTYPDNSFLVLAVDLPFFDENTMDRLLTSRDKSKIATAYATKKTKLPEPLAAIWESGVKESLEGFYQKEKKTCPRKFLLTSDIQLVYPQDDLELSNINYYHEYIVAKSKISNQNGE